MSANGRDLAIESWADVEHEFHRRDEARANDQMAMMGAIGGLTAEMSGMRREMSEMRRIIIEGAVPRATDDTGSHYLRETYRALKVKSEDPASPLGTRDVRNIVEDVTAEMRLRAEVGTWRRIKAFPGWAARKAVEKAVEWAIVAALAASAAELWHILHGR